MVSTFETAVEVASRSRQATFPPQFWVSDLPDQLPRDVRRLAKSLLTKEELTIVSWDATEVRDKLAAGVISAVKVIEVISKAAVHAHQLTNCLTDFFYPQALFRAQELDLHLQTTGKPIGPLHGVPISLKDHMQVEGRPTSAGWLAWDGQVSSADSALVKQMWDLGAIFYCRTTLPQSHMQLESTWYLGKTSNPFDLDATSGGSSGGEGALIALKGSYLGIGGDIGGSLRIPAVYNGIYTLKPTTFRISNIGFRGAMPGAEAILPVCGPMTRSLRDLTTFMTAITSSPIQHLDPAVLPLGWRTPQPFSSSRLLRLGYYESDGVVTPHPPIQRAMRETLRKLHESGMVEVVEFEPRWQAEGGDLVVGSSGWCRGCLLTCQHSQHELYFTDGGKRIRDLAAESGEPIVPLTEWVLTRPTVKDHTMHELWEVVHRRNAFRSKFATYWHSQNVDAVLAPCAPTTAPKHGTTKYWGYTNIWNLLDYPATAFPTGFVDPAMDKVWEDFRPLSELDASVQADFNPQTQAGHPLGLQVVTFRYKDEESVAAAELISRIITA